MPAQFDIATSTLTPVQVQVVAALAQGATVSAAAAAYAVHRSTIHQWRNTLPEFAAAVEQARRELLLVQREELENLSLISLSALRSLLEDRATPPAVKLRTALAVLQRPQEPSAGWALAEVPPTPEMQQLTHDMALLQTDIKLMCQDMDDDRKRNGESDDDDDD